MKSLADFSPLKMSILVQALYNTLYYACRATVIKPMFIKVANA